jgi:hypothetical protein
LHMGQVIFFVACPAAMKLTPSDHHT